MGLSGDIDSLLGLINSRRVIAIQGHYGSGKTALAFRLAIELIEKYDYKHIISNCQSILNDDYHEVHLDENGLLNAVIIIDEAGESLQKMSDTKGWLAFPRRFNICFILSTWDSLPSNVTKIEVSRIENLERLGVPTWVYGISLDGGKTKDEKFKVSWRNPSEIFGVYDTDGFGGGTDELLDWLKGKVSELAKKRGYAETSLKYAAQTRSLFGNIVNEQLSEVEGIGGQTNESDSIQTETSDTLPVSVSKASSRQNTLFARALSCFSWVGRLTNRTPLNGGNME